MEVEARCRQPRVRQCLFDGQSEGEIRLDELDYEFLCVPAGARPDGLGEFVVARADLFEKRSCVAAIEGRLSREQHVRDNADGPHITALVILSFEYLRRDVVGGAKFRIHERVLILQDLAHPEVYQLDGGKVPIE